MFICKQLHDIYMHICWCIAGLKKYFDVTKFRCNAWGELIHVNLFEITNTPADIYLLKAFFY